MLAEAGAVPLDGLSAAKSGEPKTEKALAVRKTKRNLLICLAELCLDSLAKDRRGTRKRNVYGWAFLSGIKGSRVTVHIKSAPALAKSRDTVAGCTLKNLAASA